MTKLHKRLVSEVAQKMANHDSRLEAHRSFDEDLYESRVAQFPVSMLIKALSPERQAWYKKEFAEL